MVEDPEVVAAAPAAHQEALKGIWARLACLAVASAASAQLRQVAYLKASNPKANDHFGNGGTLEGHGVALSGDGNTLAVGAQLENGGSKGINGKQDDLSAEDSGALYLFTRTGTTWTQKAYIKSSNAEAYDEFGSAMALSRDGKILAVGARSEASAAKGINGDMNDNSAMGSGAVYIFANQ